MAITFDEIPDVISNLSEPEKRSLRLTKLYGEYSRPSYRDYLRYVGTAHLSVNWICWRDGFLLMLFFHYIWFDHLLKRTCLKKQFAHTIALTVIAHVLPPVQLKFLKPRGLGLTSFYE